MNKSAADRRSPRWLFPGQPEPGLYSRVVELPHTRHHSRRTEEVYIRWNRRFPLSDNDAHPRELAENAPNRIEGVVRAREPKRPPVVLTRDEVRAILAQRDGAPRLVSMLLHGLGLRFLEGLGLRVKDRDFGCGEIIVQPRIRSRRRAAAILDSLGHDAPRAIRH
jgi:integrase